MSVSYLTVFFISSFHFLFSVAIRYSEFAKGQDREIPSLKKKGFVFFQG